MYSTDQFCWQLKGNRLPNIWMGHMQVKSTKRTGANDDDRCKSVSQNWFSPRREGNSRVESSCGAVSRRI